MFINLPSILLKGLEGEVVSLEIDVGRGMPGFNIIGLASASIQESKSRVRLALRNSGFEFPYEKKVLVNLAPAYLAKEGSYFDLAIACGLVLANFDLPDPMLAQLNRTIMLGELSLKGEVRGVDLLCPLLNAAIDQGFRDFIISEEDANKAGLFPQLNLKAVKDLKQAVGYFLGQNELKDITPSLSRFSEQRAKSSLDSIIGQTLAKRALLLSAVGRHHLVFYGQPGSGKTMLSFELANILPDLCEEKALEVISIYSIAGLYDLRLGQLLTPPFRSPHHSSSMAALIGGGSRCMPGEISLAHRGVLFLDEFLEFGRQALEALRQPLESKTVTVSRAKAHVKYPADFILVGAFNPCPCGYFGSQDHECVCLPTQLASYKSRLSGPLMDRIDMFVEVSRIKESELLSEPKDSPDSSLRTRVKEIIEFTEHRRSSADFVSQKVRQEWIKIMSAYKLSLRSGRKLLKLARTIADAGFSSDIKSEHLAEAIQFRFRSS